MARKFQTYAQASTANALHVNYAEPRITPIARMWWTEGNQGNESCWGDSEVETLLIIGQSESIVFWG